MIIICSENELVNVHSWEEITGRPRYRRLDPKVAQFEKVIGKYEFPTLGACGLTECGRSHMKGYILATVDGWETNIGHECGEKYFGLKFKQSVKALERDIRRRDQREAIRTFQASSASYRARLDDIRGRDDGLTCMFFGLKALVRELPKSVRYALMDMVKSQDYRITTEREATKAEIEAEEARLGKAVSGPRYVTQVVGMIEGVGALDPRNDLYEMSSQLSKGLEKVMDLDPDVATDWKLTEASKWISEFDARLAQMRRSALEARRLMTQENLIQFARTKISSADKAQLRRAVAEFPRSLSGQRAA